MFGLTGPRTDTNEFSINSARLSEIGGVSVN